MNEALQTTGASSVGMPLKTLEDILKMGDVIEKAGMFGFSQSGQGAVVVMTCLQENISLLKFRQTYHIIDGVPSMRADAMLAKFQELGGTYEIVERTPDVAAITMSYRGNVQTFRLSWEQAKAEPFVYKKDGKELKTNWKTPRARMQTLWARVVSDGVRAVCPMVNSGLYPPEELEPHADVVPVIVTSTPAGDTPPPELLPPPAPVEVDYSVVPCGARKGTKWADLPDKALAVALNWAKPEMTDGHRSVIRAEIARREQAPKEGAE